MNKTAMICLMVGGRAQRMGRGVKSIDKTKGLLEIPFESGTETLIDRNLRLLKKIGAITEPSDVLLCVGYKALLVIGKYPEYLFLETYDPDDPTDVLPAYLKVIEAYPNIDRLIFIMGDTVWSEDALRHFWESSDTAPMVVYHGTEPYYCEIFGIAVNDEEGRDLIRKANAVESMPIVAGEIRWTIQNITEIGPKDCRSSCMEQWIDRSGLPGKVRVYQSAFVDDIDWEADHQRICGKIKAGEC